MDDKIPDPDDGLELNEEIVKRLRRSLEKAPESFLSPEEMCERLKISPLTFYCAICGVGFKRLDWMVMCAESHKDEWIGHYVWLSEKSGQLERK